MKGFSMISSRTSLAETSCSPVHHTQNDRRGAGNKNGTVERACIVFVVMAQQCQTIRAYTPKNCHSDGSENGHAMQETK